MQLESALAGTVTIVFLLLGASAAAAALAPGEYACAGSGGRILIGLGFKLLANGTYTDLDVTTSGRVVYQGSGLRFVGGHLDGQIGRNIAGGTNVDLGAASCSRN